LKGANHFRNSRKFPLVTFSDTRWHYETMRAPRVGCQPDREGVFNLGWPFVGNVAQNCSLNCKIASFYIFFFLRLIRNLRVGYQRTLEKGVKPRQIVHSESRTSGFTPFLTKILKFLLIQGKFSNKNLITNHLKINIIYFRVRILKVQKSKFHSKIFEFKSRILEENLKILKIIW